MLKIGEIAMQSKTTKSNNNKINNLKETNLVSRKTTKRQHGINPDKTTSASKLIRDVSQMTGLPKSKVRNVLEGFKVALLHETYRTNKKVILRGFGTFDVQEKKAKNSNLAKNKETTRKGKTKTYKLTFKCSRKITYNPDNGY